MRTRKEILRQAHGIYHKKYVWCKFCAWREDRISGEHSCEICRSSDGQPSEYVEHLGENIDNINLILEVLLDIRDLERWQKQYLAKGEKKK
jgi:hypothetical protein